MRLLLIVLGIFLCEQCEASNFNPDYPNVSICVIPEIHTTYKNTSYAYQYLRRVVGLDNRCTHIYGNLVISGIDRLANGEDPDLRFLESIEEISGSLVINDNTVRRIPLVNLKVIRGLSKTRSTEGLEIYHNWRKGMPSLEEVDLRSLRAVLNKNIMLNANPGLNYLHYGVDWTQLIDPYKQKIVISDSSQNRTFKCHSRCNSWESSAKVTKQFCFGPTEHECQPRTRCVVNKGSPWCNFTGSTEIPCNNNCAGGCYGETSGDCVVCNKYFKKSNCTQTCSNHDIVFGVDYSTKVKDNLTYTVAGLCTSQCPASLLEQDKICIFQCNFDKYYRSGKRCLDCLQECKSKGDICNLKELNPTFFTNGRTNKLNVKTLERLTKCKTIIGQVYIDDDSFTYGGVTVPLLYKHLRNVREISGDLSIILNSTPMNNLTFLSNLVEIRHSDTEDTSGMALSIDVKSLNFLGLKKLENVYGSVIIYGHKDLCYLDKIPWNDISPHVRIHSTCNKTCDPLCTNGCWGPGDEFCHKCQFEKASGRCVKQCSDAKGFYTNRTSLNTTECRKCHPLCKENCTGPSAKDCNKECKFAMENDTCVKTCSIGYYPTFQNGSTHSLCKPCHPLCFLPNDPTYKGFACSGPTNLLGAGGCAMCHTTIKTEKNETRCHADLCPVEYMKKYSTDSTKRIISSCEPCHRLCTNCIGLSNSRNDCKSCKGYMLNDMCVETCPNDVKNYTAKIELGGDCPRCHKQCNGCFLANDNTKCQRCVNFKLVDKSNHHNFTCVKHCPADRNSAERINEETVCLTLAETAKSRQKKIITYIIIGCLGSLVIIIILFVICFRWKSYQAETKAEIKAMYSNYKEPNMKKMNEDHISRPPNMKRLQMIPLSDLIFDTASKPLGSGAFGKVFRGYWKVPRIDNKIYSLDVVIKVIHNSSKTSTDEFLEEAKIMASVSHRHCLPLIGVCFSLDKPGLVSTYAECGSLDKYLHQYGKKISSYSMLVWAEQIADGMAYLNMRSIIHRDLAARNILVNSKNIIQITDFGLARFVDESDDSIVVKSGRVPIRWLALETLLNATYSSATDVWAYGVTLWEIFTYGKRPYENLETSDIKTYLQQGNRLCQPEISTLDVYMVMIKCWLDDPHMRPTFIELMSIFEQFSLTPKRFLYLQQEHVNHQVSKNSDTRTMIGMHQISVDSDFRQTAIVNNKSDEMSWGTALHNDSAYQLISNSYGKNQKEDQSFLPSRKKTKRNISFEKIRSFSKFDLSKILLNKLQRDSKSYSYQPTNNYEGSKTTCTSFDSLSPLVVHRALEYEGQPMNHQVEKFKDVIQNRQVNDGSSKFENPLKTPERVFVDKVVKDETECLLGSSAETPKPDKEVTKPPNLPPIDIPKVIPRTNKHEQPSRGKHDHENQNSPDSGNSHNFDIDDYLVPSHISSAGYYNVTPSPQSTAKRSMNLCDSPLLINNADYADDGYLEPVKIINR